ncbi:hypothetical protein ABKN59_010124 [Abortiporus biennis]
MIIPSKAQSSVRRVSSCSHNIACYIDIPLFNATYAFVLSNSPREIIFTVLLLLTNAKSSIQYETVDSGTSSVSK